MITLPLSEAPSKQSPIDNILSKLKIVPGGSDTYNRILRELRDPAGTLEQVGHFVGSDPAITTEVLKHANSAALGFTRIVNDPKDAVMLLGGEQILAIVMMVDVFSLGNHNNLQGIPLPDFFLFATAELVCRRPSTHAT